MARYKKKTNAAAVVILAVVCVVMAAVIALAAVSKGFTDFSRFNRKQAGTPADSANDTLYAPDTGMSINQISSNGIMLLSAPLDLNDFEAYNIDENVESVKTITARFTPADTTLQKVDYTAAWRNASSSWATGKDVEDYLNLTQSSDGSLDCAVSALQAFGEQIIITCTARPLEEGDTVPTATCTVDYYKRITSVSLRFWGWYTNKSNIKYTVDVAEGSTLTFKDYYYEDSDDSNDWDNEFEVTQTMGIGTIVDNPADVSVKISISDSVAQSVKNAAGISQLNSFSPVNKSITGGLYLRTELTNILGGTSNLNSRRSAIYNAFKSAYDSGTPALKVEISFTASPSGFSYNFTYNVHLNPLLLGVKATGLELDKPGIIFSLQSPASSITSNQFEF